MRVLPFIFIIVLAVSVSAQTPFIQKTFDNATIAAQTGNYEKALENYRRTELFAKTEKTVSDDFRAVIHFNIGVSLYRLRQNAVAVKEFTEAIKLSKRNYQKAFYALGMAQAELKNWRESEQAFLGAIRLNKRDAEAWFDLAFVYLAQENYDAAKRTFEKSIELKSVASSIARNNVGVIFALKGDLTSAVREFEIALKISHGNLPEAERNLKFCRSLGQKFSRELVAKLEVAK